MVGDLGAGKTTVAQAIIAELGNTSPVTSPTYTLIQEYPVSQGIVYHMDLYRLNDPAELEFLGLIDLWSDRSLFLIEWPERGGDWVPTATHRLTINTPKDAGSTARELQFERMS